MSDTDNNHTVIEIPSVKKERKRKASLDKKNVEDKQPVTNNPADSIDFSGPTGSNEGVTAGTGNTADEKSDKPIEINVTKAVETGDSDTPDSSTGKAGRRLSRTGYIKTIQKRSRVYDK